MASSDLVRPSWREKAREQLPLAAQAVTEFVVDNPLQVGLTISGIVVLDRILFNAVRPRGPVQILATAGVASILAPLLLKKAIEHGLIKFSFRDGASDAAADLPA